MAILNWFSQKQERQKKQRLEKAQGERTRQTKRSAQQMEAAVGGNKEEAEKFSQTAVALQSEAVGIKNAQAGGFRHVIHSAYITEKTTAMQAMGKYVFRIFPNAHARQVASAIEALYKVHVRDVHIVKLPAKKVRRGRHTATRTRYPKAIVTLKPGETIEVVPN